MNESDGDIEQVTQEQALVSVIIPLYNNEKYIAACVDSVLAQTYSKWEAIIVDDGSTDGGYAICELYAKRDHRISVIRQENKRVGAARNLGLSMAHGEYVMFIDSDDMIEPDAMERAIRVILNHQADMVQWEAHFFDSDDDHPDVYGKKNSVSYYEVVADSWEAMEYLLDTRGKGNDPHFRMLRNSCRCVWSKFCRRNLFDRIRFPENLEYEDDFIVHHLYLAAEKIVFINLELTNKRNHATSVLHLMPVKGQFDHLECEYERLVIASRYNKEKHIMLAAHVFFAALLNLVTLNHLSGVEFRQLHLRAKKEYSIYRDYLTKEDRLAVSAYLVVPHIFVKLFKLYRAYKKS